MDSVKPLERRHEWSPERVAEYNRDRVEALADAGWDLIVVDEAHRLAGSTEQVARYKLGRALAEAAPHLLLLTATPHQGKSDAFRRLVSMVDKYVLPDSVDISSERMREIVIRTEKRRAMDSDGKPLFKPRRTRLRAISWTERHAAQRTLYEAVTEYAREGYNRAMLEKKRHVGFLMVLLQRLVTSSTRAIRTALERRLEALEVPDDQLTLFPETAEEEWLDLDAQERIDALLASRLKAMKNERAEVKLLLAAARHAEEHRVREVIEEKLAVILDELGIDKTGDILDSAQAARIFDDLYVEAIARPGGLEAKAESVAEECLGIGVALSASRALLGNSGSLDLGDTRSLMDHPLPHWVNLDGVELPGGDSVGAKHEAKKCGTTANDRRREKDGTGRGGSRTGGPAGSPLRSRPSLRASPFRY